MEVRRGRRHDRLRRGRGDDGVVAVNSNARRRLRSTPQTSIILRHILTRYSIFFPTKTFSFLRGVGVVRRCGAREVREDIPSPPPIPFSLLSLPFFLMFFYGISLSCPQTLLSLSFAPIFTKGWGITPRGEGAVDKGRGGNENF